MASCAKRILPLQTEADICVWPPVLVGQRDMSILNSPADFLYIEDSSLGNFIKEELQRVAERWTHKGTEIFFTRLSCVAKGTKNRSLYVLSSESVEGYLAARHIDRLWAAKSTEVIKRFRKAGWSLSYATVRDMAEIDPHRKLVEWIPLYSDAELGLKKSLKINEPQCAQSLYFSKDLEARLKEIKAAELYNESFSHGKDHKYSLKLEAMLQEGFMKPVKEFLMDAHARELEVRELFAFDCKHVARASTERLNSLGRMMAASGYAVSNNAGKAITTKMINRGVNLELDTLQSLTEEIHKTGNNHIVKTFLENDYLESTQKLIQKLKDEMLQHLLKSWNECQSLLEAEMASRLKLVKCVRHTEEEVTAITKLATEDQKQKLKSPKGDVAIRAASLKELREAKYNQECIICYNELEGFSLSSGQGKPSPSKKLLKRACFLPCMHATICITCSNKRWNEGPRLCPICCQKLTEKPRVIYL